MSDPNPNLHETVRLESRLVTRPVRLNPSNRRQILPASMRRLLGGALVLFGTLSVSSAGVILQNHQAEPRQAQPVSLPGGFSVIQAPPASKMTVGYKTGLQVAADAPAITASVLAFGPGSPVIPPAMTSQTKWLLASDGDVMSGPRPLDFDLFTPRGSFADVPRNRRGASGQQNSAKREMTILSRKQLQQIELREGLIPATGQRTTNTADFAFQRAVSSLFSGATSGVWSRQLSLSDSRVYRRFGRDLLGYEDLRKVVYGKVKAAEL